MVSGRVITQADRMLVHMEHRGGASAEPTSGDGAGIMLGLPHDYYALVCSSELSLALQNCLCEPSAARGS